MIRDRIKKLFALARDKGASEHEAARALEMAQRLMMKHGINGHDLEDGPPLGWGNRVDIDHRWHKILHNSIAHLYAVVSIQDDVYLVFVGKNENVGAAEETMVFISEQVENLYKTSLPKGLDKKARSEFRKNFKEGCTLRIRSRILELVEAQTTRNEKAAELGTTALVVRTHREQLLKDAEEYLKSSANFVKGRTMKIRGGYGFEAGKNAGNLVNIHKTVQ